MSTVAGIVQDAIHRDLKAFAAAAQLTPVSDRRTWQSLAARWDVLTAGLQEHIRADPSGAGVDELRALLASCTDGFTTAARCRDDDARAALAVRITALRESARRDLPGPPAGWGPVPRSRLPKVLPWALHGASRQARESVLRSGGPTCRLVWWLSRRAFERQQRKAFRYVPDV